MRNPEARRGVHDLDRHSKNCVKEIGNKDVKKMTIISVISKEYEESQERSGFHSLRSIYAGLENPAYHC
jgi:hypothetical protein